MATPHSQPLGDPIPLRLTQRTKKRIKQAASHLHWSEADTLRLLIDTGLIHLERIDYDIAAAIVDRATHVSRIRPKS
jgi:predicted DNA-binding protein